MNMFRKGIALLLAFCLLAFTGCSVSLKSSKEEKTPVATIGGYDVPYELYRYVVLNYKTQFEDGQSADVWLGESGKALMEELNANVEYSLVKMYTALSLCEEYGLTPDNPLISGTVDVRMDAIYESFEGDLKAYKEYITDGYMNDSVYRFLVQNEVLGEELFYLLQNKGVIEKDEDVLRQMMDTDTFIRVKQILIPDNNGLSEEENRGLIEDIYARLENGEDFEELMGMYGQDLYMFNNDDGYYIAPGSRFVEFEEAAFGLAVGEYSPVVKTPAGYSIIKRYEKDAAYIDAHFDELCQEYFDGAYNVIMEEHAASLTMTVLPAMEKYSIFTME
ncbi:MAG: hypothetical protein E7658_09085 [Ruminococcaceae bacterium]|nr:hypothetical protein [Oscillospiraceae bacterium]